MVFHGDYRKYKASDNGLGKTGYVTNVERILDSGRLILGEYTIQ